MNRFIRKSMKAAGTAPGTLAAPPPAHDLDQGQAPSRISVMIYTPQALSEHEVQDIHQAHALVTGPGSSPDNTAWIHVCGVVNTDLLRQAGNHFDIHDLTLEDIANTAHRPKFEDFDDHFFMILKHLSYDADRRMIHARQISLMVKNNLLITFQEGRDAGMEPVRKRIRSGRGRIRGAGSGYLAYAVLDSVVDHYFHLLAQVGDDIETLENQMLETVDSRHMAQIHSFRREILFFHKQVWPVREAVSSLIRSDVPVMLKTRDRFMEDVYDHLIFILETAESMRELISGLREFHMSAMGNRMNEVMRTLTIIATIFIPLTFLAGIYGMNFKFMPELDWKWGYFSLMGIMLAMGTAMVLYFRRKKWF